MKPSGEAKQAYIQIATRRFAMDGFHGSSLSQLAKDAGVSKQALLHFFKTKEALYEATLTSLAERMMRDLVACRQAYSMQWLLDYFTSLSKNAYADPTDMRLVVHALLDSDQNARKWPLKPYLDKVIRIVSETPGGRVTDVAAHLAWVSQMIGMTQYHIISVPTVSGMYGTDSATGLQQEMLKRIEYAVREFCLA